MLVITLKFYANQLLDWNWFEEVFLIYFVKSPIVLHISNQFIFEKLHFTVKCHAMQFAIFLFPWLPRFTTEIYTNSI